MLNLTSHLFKNDFFLGFWKIYPCNIKENDHYLLNSECIFKFLQILLLLDTQNSLITTFWVLTKFSPLSYATEM